MGDLYRDAGRQTPSFRCRLQSMAETVTAFDAPDVARWRAVLSQQGWLYLPLFQQQADGGERAQQLARCLGPLWLPADTPPSRPVIVTSPRVDATTLEPFDRAEAIGWHNDFSTHERRPCVSLAYLERADPHGPTFGAWRVASTALVIGELNATVEGREAARLLSDTDLPFSFTGVGAPLFFRVLTRDPNPAMRFYGRALRDGARLAYGKVPGPIEDALSAVEKAADWVGITLAAPAGALLVTHNGHSLHDRLTQSVEAGPPLRRSILCFVDCMHPSL